MSILLTHPHTLMHHTHLTLTLTHTAGTARRLVFPNSSGLFEVKRSLHNSAPSSLLCRDQQLSCLTKFIQTHVEKKRPGSLYVSGAPGVWV